MRNNEGESGVALCKQTTVPYRRALSSPLSLTSHRLFQKVPILTTSTAPSNGFLQQLRPTKKDCNLGLNALIGASRDIGTRGQRLVKRVSVASPLYLWHASRNPVPANECAENLWQEHHRWVIACWCRKRIKRLGTFVEKDRVWERLQKILCKKYFFCGGGKKGWKKKSLWCLLKILIEEPKKPSLIRCSRFNVSWITLHQWSGSIFPRPSRTTPCSSAVLKYKLKRQESSKAIPHTSV